MTTPLARLLDAIPVMASVAERTARFPSPSPDQRVYVKDIRATQRYDATLGWVTDTPGGTVTALTDAAAIATDANLGPVFTVTLGGNRTMGVPTNPVPGQRITYHIVQDGGGGRTLAWDEVFKTAWSDTGNTANKRSSISFDYDGANWLQAGAQAAYY